MPENGECRICQAPVFWIRSVYGSFLPLDVKPNPQGNVVLRDNVGHRIRLELWEPRSEETRYKLHQCAGTKPKKRRKQ